MSWRCGPVEQGTHPHCPQTIHWSVPDPSATGDYATFRALAADPHTRVTYLLHVIASSNPEGPITVTTPEPVTPR